jgi:murein DD-endopeptidase MepM/ murein hydrolase activator NlpD
MISPIFNEKLNVPSHDQAGGFGFKRTFYYHPGVDLYCLAGQAIVAIEPGVVVNIETFTGALADPPSPWWNETQAILIEGESGALGYCEIVVMPYHKVGDEVEAGDLLGFVVPVLKKDKGNGTTMLHFEQYVPGTRSHVTWHIGEEKPLSLLDPTELLKRFNA